MTIGKNAPCPCGSGKKYKRCCLNKDSFIEVKPSNQPEVIDYHLVGNGKTWTKRPGILDALLVAADSSDTDSQIEGIFKETFDYFLDDGYRELREKLHDCKHKIYAVRNYKLAIETEIKNRVEDFNKEYKAISGIKLEKENHKLIYDTESFLFQVKSSLDLLTRALGFIFPALRQFRTFKHSGEKDDFIAGGKVIRALRRDYQELANLLEENRRLWIQDMAIMRDTITHVSRLKNFHCFIEEPYLGAEKVKIHYPTMPSGERVDRYCERIYENLRDFYGKVFNLLKNVAKA